VVCRGGPAPVVGESDAALSGSEKNSEEHVGTDMLDDAGRRDIIAEGMQRFEGIAKTAPPQVCAAEQCIRDINGCISPTHKHAIVVPCGVLV